MTTSDDPATDRPVFVVYVYPGWHLSDYRTVDEWDLLERAPQLFPGHRPPARPLDGTYDDAQDGTARRQLMLVAGSGISALSYFTYFSGERLIMNIPWQKAMQQAPTVEGVRLAMTLCVRLPHPTFPVGPVPALADGVEFDRPPDADDTGLLDRDLSTLGPGELHAILAAIASPKTAAR
ncbi:glycosyl transferase family WbsX [Asanoa ferruginea]|uniref:Glycosyl transferase family WbsX n=1 Tax=Asanoa ferruginea TaxID=53367 RepID=A0A3D9ZWN4_9ACTN|nr:glycoside hydrolase family 99-like domain-containing protein [Asanoa ferruginea]REG01015.1 glycosyl transferase family WbsX [Asanoa ferruginea]GIF47615.1 hypothetical protein Afe04nite_21540 [Asanoa ferruginea]